MITFNCPACMNEMSVKDEHAGKAGKCKRCGEVLKVPVPEPEISVFDKPEYKEALKKAEKKKDDIPRNADGNIDWYGTWCPHCKQRCSVKKMMGNGFILGVFILVSVGLALILLPFLPREWHCLSCHNRWRA